MLQLILRNQRFIKYFAQPWGRWLFNIRFSNHFILYLQTTPQPIDKCFSSIFWMLSNWICLSPSQARASQWSFTSGSSERHLHNRDERCKQMKGGGGGRNNNRNWHGWSWPTRVTLSVGSSCCPPSLPPSCLTQLMSKPGSVQRSQCGEGSTPCCQFFIYYFFGEPSDVIFHKTWKFKTFHQTWTVSWLLGVAAGRIKLTEWNLWLLFLQKCKCDEWSKTLRPLKPLTKHAKHRDEMREKHY